jgi:hypothetical protein
MAKHVAILLALAAFTVPAQNPKSAPNFDVASIRELNDSSPRTQCYMRG